MGKALAYILLLSLFFCCDYEPEGEYFKNVPSPDPNEISLELTTSTNDTLFLFERTIVGYKSLLGDGKFKGISVYLDDNLIYSTGLPEVTYFVVEAAYIEDGIYNLRIELKSSSGSGSLADVMGQEDLHLEKNWTVVIEKKRPDPVPILSIREIDGTLKIEWERFENFTFQRYVITKYCFDPLYNTYIICWAAEVQDQNATSLSDSTYIGGKAKYAVRVKAANQESDVSEKEFDSPYNLEFAYEWLDNKNMKLSWRKSTFHQNFSYYQIAFTASNDNRSFKIENVSDTTLILDAGLKFPGTKTLVLEAHPREINSYNRDYVYQHLDISQGTPFPLFYENTLTFNVALQKYFSMRKSGDKFLLVRIDGTTNEEEQSILAGDGKYTLSENGLYLYYSDYDHLYQLDPLDFSLINSFDLAELNGSGNYIWEYNVSDDNMLSATNFTGTFVVNMNNFSIVQQFPYDFQTKISPDGNFLVMHGKVLLLAGQQYSQTGGFTFTGTPKTAFNGNKELILYYTGTIKIIDLATQSIARSNISEASYCSFDPVTGLIGGFSDDVSSQNKFYLFDPAQGEQVSGFDIANISSDYPIILANNKLIWSHGRIIPLSHYYP
jgi:hypothetical protein